MCILRLTCSIQRPDYFQELNIANSSLLLPKLSLSSNTWKSLFEILGITVIYFEQVKVLIKLNQCRIKKIYIVNYFYYLDIIFVNWQQCKLKYTNVTLI